MLCRRSGAPSPGVWKRTIQFRSLITDVGAQGAAQKPFKWNRVSPLQPGLTLAARETQTSVYSKSGTEHNRLRFTLCVLPRYYRCLFSEKTRMVSGTVSYGYMPHCVGSMCRWQASQQALTAHEPSTQRKSAFYSSKQSLKQQLSGTRISGYSTSLHHGSSVRSAVSCSGSQPAGMHPKHLSLET